MKNSHVDDHSSCGCKGIFCCIFPSSRDPNQARDRVPAFSAPTNEAKESRPALDRQADQNYSGVEKHVPKQSNRSDSDMNKAFSEYIDHARVKIRAMSNVGSDDVEIVYTKTDEARDHGNSKADANDMFSEYIARAKMKIRKTSSIGSKRMISFRK